MTISIYDSRLKRLSMLAEKRHLDYWHMQEFNTFLVSSSRKGHAPHRVRIEGEEISRDCEASQSSMACSHASLIVERRFPSIALAWATEDARAFYEKRLAIEKGEVGKRELNRYRKAYFNSLPTQNVEVAA